MSTEKNLQESLIQYPLFFPLKVMGLTQPHFKETIGNAVRELDTTFDPSSIKTDLSKQGKYTALKFSVYATSREHLDAIYMMLSSHPMVKVVL